MFGMFGMFRTGSAPPQGLKAAFIGMFRAALVL
jgi:hypothetical protein